MPAKIAPRSQNQLRILHSPEISPEPRPWTKASKLVPAIKAEPVALTPAPDPKPVTPSALPESHPAQPRHQPFRKAPISTIPIAVNIRAQPAIMRIEKTSPATVTAKIVPNTVSRESRIAA